VDNLHPYPTQTSVSSNDSGSPNHKAQKRRGHSCRDVDETPQPAGHTHPKKKNTLVAVDLLVEST
jgi:hypothetical protein